MGGYITYSDQLDIYSLNDGWATRLQKNQGRAVGEMFENKIKNINMVPSVLLVIIFYFIKGLVV